MNKNCHNYYVFLTIATFIFALLILMLTTITKPQVVVTTGYNVIIAKPNSDESFCAYHILFDKKQFLLFKTNKLVIFFPLNQKTITIYFPQWNENGQFLINKNSNCEIFHNQTVLITAGRETLLTFIWNNITT